MKSFSKIQGKAIGILGGMGPEASVYMYKMLIELSIRYFGARNNDDFPEIILHSIPVPDFISSNAKKEDALQMLQKRVEQFNKLSISCIGIACNTVHVLFPQLTAVSRYHFISMITEVVNAVDEKIEVVGVLGTPSTIRFRLYHEALEKRGKKVVSPTKKQIATLESVIRNVIAGKFLKEDTKKLALIAQSLQEKGAQGIILGCTELPLVFPKKYSVPIYNSVEILAMSLLRNYYK